MIFTASKIILIVLILDLIYIVYAKLKTNKINPIAWLIVVIPLAFYTLDVVGLRIEMNDPLFLFSIIILIIGISALILGKRYVDAKIQDSKTSLDIIAKIDLLKESIDRVENKIDKLCEII